jgi:hypothetical protein
MTLKQEEIENYIQQLRNDQKRLSDLQGAFTKLEFDKEIAKYVYPISLFPGKVTYIIL